MIIEFDERDGFIDAWILRIKDYYRELVDANEHITNFLEKYHTSDKPFKFGLRTESLGTHAIRDIFGNHKGHVSRKYVESRLKELTHIEQSSIFSMETYVDCVDGKINVTGCMLTIRRSVLARDLCNRIYDLDSVWEQHKWLLKHEVGHLIDYMINMQGRTRAELLNRYEETREAYSRHREWVAKYKKEPGFDIHRINRAYYNIPTEARANEYAGIDIEDMIKTIKETSAKYANKRIKFKIEILEITDEVGNK